MIRDYVKSTLPMEVMYASENGLPPPAIIEHMETKFNVKFIDVRKIKGFPSAMTLKVSIAILI